MNRTEHIIHLHFDKFVFTVSYNTVEKFICNELNRLSIETGYRIDNLKIEFKKNFKDNTIAFFSHSGDKPIGFCFYTNKLDNMSPNKIIDTCRHEFAHYIVCMQNPKHQPKCIHGKKWQEVCYELGAKPSPYMKSLLTKHIK